MSDTSELFAIASVAHRHGWQGYSAEQMSLAQWLDQRLTDLDLIYQNWPEIREVVTIASDLEKGYTVPILEATAMKYHDHAAAFIATAQKHMSGDKSHEFQKGFNAGILAAAENIEAAAKLFPGSEQTQFALDAAADMKAHAESFK